MQEVCWHKVTWIVDRLAARCCALARMAEILDQELPRVGHVVNICSRFGSQRREEGMSKTDVWVFSYQFFEPDVLV